MCPEPAGAAVAAGAPLGLGTGRGASPSLPWAPPASPGAPAGVCPVPGWAALSPHHPGVGQPRAAVSRCSATSQSHQSLPHPLEFGGLTVFLFLLLSPCPEKIRQFMWFNLPPKEAVSALLGLETKANKTALA